MLKTSTMLMNTAPQSRSVPRTADGENSSATRARRAGGSGGEAIGRVRRVRRPGRDHSPDQRDEDDGQDADPEQVLEVVFGQQDPAQDGRGGAADADGTKRDRQVEGAAGLRRACGAPSVT
ncbi:hypothetical protein K8Z49_37700 [Actinomadura madurae]|uniref:hypothetical protein n=1 Tax=Actinomadura madurae TaxID=1993 RepID=UPI003999A626